MPPRSSASVVKGPFQIIADVSGGRNGYDAPWAIANNQCVDAVNVDFYRTKLGNKRQGITLPAITGITTTGIISSLFRHVPGTDETAAELWFADDSVTPIINRVAGGTAASAPTLKDNPTGNGWDETAASINGKLFLAYLSAQSRMHCWDGSTVRRAGLPAPVAPSVTNTGAATSIAFDASASLNYGATTTFSHTCAASATHLFVAIRSANSVTGVTYNAVSMTNVGSVVSTDNYTVWVLTSPSSGANTVSITVSGGGNVGALSASYIRSTTGQNTDGGGTVGPTASATPSISLTTTLDNDWSVFVAADRSGSNPTAGTNTTFRVQASAATDMTLFDSNGPITPPQIYTQTATCVAGNSAVALMFPFGGGVSAYAAILRYYRVRWSRQSGGITIGRSEPGTSQSFTPSGTGTGAVVTQPATAGEGETHWEVEASIDNTTFYRLATVPIGTTTYTDSAATSTYNINPLSAATGFYTLPPSAKFVASDQGRMLMFGDYTTTNRQNDIVLSAVIGSSNIGDEERVDTTTNYRIGLDEKDSGVPTGLAGPVFGSFFAFKSKQIWRLTPSGNPNNPYTQQAISKTIGAVAHVAIAAGDDAVGNPALYFMSQRGPYRWGIAGLEYIGRNVEDLVKGPNATINLVASHRIAAVTYHQDKRQVWFWWATGTSNDPNIGAIFDVQSGGWSRIPSGDLAANVRCAVAFSTVVGAQMSVALKPWVGQTGAAMRLCKADTDGTFSDLGVAYQAYVLTRAEEPGGPGFRGQVGTPLLTAVAQTGVQVYDTVIVDYGIQQVVGAGDLTPSAAGESRVTVPLHGADISDVGFIQHQVGDVKAISNGWTLDRLVTPIERHEVQMR